MENNLFDESSIFHEAGHAIACAALGGKVRQLVCLRMGELMDGMNGFIDCAEVPKDTLDHAAMYLSGCVGACWGTGRKYEVVERASLLAHKRGLKKRLKPQAGFSTYQPVREKTPGQIRGGGAVDYTLAAKLLRDRPDTDYFLAQSTAMACIAMNLPLFNELAVTLKAKMGLLRGADLQAILCRAVRPTPDQIARI